MRKLTLIALGVILVLAIGCSGGRDIVTPPPTERDVAIGSFQITDLDGNLVASGSLARDDSGKLIMGELREGDLIIDLTWLGWFDAECEYLNGRGYLPSGWVIYHCGDNMQYKVHITNYAMSIPACYIRTEQRYYYGGALCGGESVEEWFNVNLPGCAITTLYDEWYILMHPGYGATWALLDFNFNFWCIQFHFILYHGVCGIFEP